MNLFRAGSVFLLSISACLAQPRITSVENAASNIPPGLPNAPIAQGATFVVKGSNLGPAAIVIDSEFPFSTSLAGTSVRVTVGGQTRDGIMYYTLDRQIAAILPSSTPAGTGTLTVTYNGQTSATFPITVVASNLGLYTLNSSGSGGAVATFQIPPEGGPYLGNRNAAMADDVVIFWGTGLGAIGADETVAAPGGDMTNVPLEVYIGGKQAEILYRGRNGCCSSVDAIYVRVPQGVAGCVTPVTMKIGNLVSNTATIPIGAGGRTCTPTNPAVSQSLIDRIIAQGSYTVGGVGFGKTTVTTAATIPGTQATTTRSDDGAASFLRVSGDIGAAFNAQIESVSFGACNVYSFTGQTPPVPNLQTQGLDAGASIGVNGPNGARTLTRLANQTGVYSANLSQSGDYLVPGPYTVTGPGGADVGSFSVPVTLPPTLVWTNAAASTTVNRANGLTVTWTGGDPNGLVQISGLSFRLTGTDATSAVGGYFICTAKTTDGSFTVPSIVLLALPPSGVLGIPGFEIPFPGVLSIASATATFANVNGLDFFSVGSAITTTQSATYQ
jgi:uncharacterized protein (TIGR03437 family)